MSTSKKLIIKQLQSNQNKSDIPSIEEVVDKQLLKNQDIRPPDGKIHPSMIGNCPRYIYFFMKKIPYTNVIPVSPRTRRIFDVGKDHETRMKRNFKESNILVEIDKPIPKNGDRVSGTCDTIICLGGKYFLCEIKTANDNQFKFNVPHKKYKYQTACYMYYLNIPNGKIYYQNKNDQSQCEINISIDDPIISETLNLIKMYNYFYDNHIIPDVSNIRPNCTSTSCFYFNECMKHSENEIKEI